VSVFIFEMSSYLVCCLAEASQANYMVEFFINHGHFPELVLI
jgi:hypothetical protein